MSDDDLVATPSSNNNSPSPSPSRSPPPPSTNNELVPLPPPPVTNRPAAFPVREDCWSEAATHTLIEAWGSHYLELKRGNLRQKHWQEVANAVNALHGHTKKQHRTDIQCKNRIDTLKKKYKIEKARVSQSNGRFVSTWPFFNSLDDLIGPNFKLSPSPATVTVVSHRKAPPVVLPPPPTAVPVGPRSKRPATAAAMEDAIKRRNFSAMAAAAAAASDDEVSEESETSSPTGVAGNVRNEGYCRLAEAIGRFAEIYERVEDAKQRQMVELEKQRMQFAKDLEIQRMKLIMESQVQLEKLKRSKNSSQADGYL